MLQVESLKNIIVTKIIKDIKAANALTYFVGASKYAGKYTRRICDKSAKRVSIQKHSNSLVFKQMQWKHLKALFTNPYLNSSEDDKYKAAMKWLNYDQSREQYFDELMYLFCWHQLQSYNIGFNVDERYQERGIKRKYDEACGENIQCPKNGVIRPTTNEELCNLFGERCIQLKDNAHLMNTFTHTYGLFKRKIPKEMLKLKISIKGEGSESSWKATQDRVTNFETHINHGDHHLEVFYQNEYNAEHVIIVTGNYTIRDNCADFTCLPKVRLIIDPDRWARYADDPLPNPKYLHRFQPEKDLKRMYRYPYMCVIGASEVNMDDAVRFVCSLNTTEDVCCRKLSSGTRYIDIWSASLESARRKHFGYDG